MGIGVVSVPSRGGGVWGEDGGGDGRIGVCGRAGRKAVGRVRPGQVWEGPRPPARPTRAIPDLRDRPSPPHQRTLPSQTHRKHHRLASTDSPSRVALPSGSEWSPQHDVPRIDGGTIRSCLPGPVSQFHSRCDADARPPPSPAPPTSRSPPPPPPLEALQALPPVLPMSSLRAPSTQPAGEPGRGHPKVGPNSGVAGYDWSPE